MAVSINAGATKPKPARQSPKKANGKAPSIGHNAEPLTEEEIEALQTHYELKIRAEQREVVQAAEVVKTKRSAVNGSFKRMTADLKYTRAEFEDMLAKRDMTEAAFLAAEAKRAAMYRRAGLPTAQGDLFDKPQDTISEQDVAYRAGLMAGRRADDPICPKTIAPILRPNWEHGYGDGQAENAMKLGIAKGVLERRAKPAASPEPDADEDLTEDQIAENARKLKKNGFLNTGEPDAVTH